MRSFSVLMKPASSLCNMRCEYCFYCDEAEKRIQASYGLMTEETLKNVIRKTMGHAEKAISFAYQGGEPTVRGIDFFRKAVAYQKQYNRKNIQVVNAFQTNGYLINEEWCRFFRENHFLVGLSVDGLSEIHDHLRHGPDGKGTFERVSHAADLMTEYQVDFNILTVVTKEVAKRIDEIYPYYKKRGWRFQQYIACMDPLDAPWGSLGYSLTPEEYGEFLVKLFELWYADVQKGEQPYIRQFENWVGIAMGYMPEACDQRGFCGIQNVVEADGSVYPCDFYMLDEYRLGNFNTDRLAAIDVQRRSIGFVERSALLNQECKACNFFRFCRGGCQRNRFLQEDGKYVNYYCESYRYFFEKCLERILTLR